ncbi:uncharacterized protein LOC130966002 [Arachis stenosperma]|uniref:uncharacterized protein LOC130966002 n=1 Tax=Arachis stenosperma TaxID=217475 RepID=UPI0025ABC973|nr:uncharacterized protein LOC130966002 [Arachis stenosperma]
MATNRWRAVISWREVPRWETEDPQRETLGVAFHHQVWFFMDSDSMNLISWNVRGASNKMWLEYTEHLGFTPVGIVEASGHRGERGGKNWVCSAVYGSPQPAIREDLWEHLLALGTSIQDPWLITGDFNEILHSQKVKGCHFNVNRRNYFSHILDSCNLFDLTKVGRSFTWFRKVQGNKEVAKKLDRACSNSSWRFMFPEAFTEVLSCLHSDHYPLLTRCLVLPVRKGSRPSKFQAAWTTHPSYKSVVHKAWNGNNTHIHGKLRKVQEASLNFNSRVFGNIFIKKRSLESKLNDLQKRLEFCDDAVVKEEEQRCRDDFNSVLL